jgi:alpha-glucosidase
VLELPHHDGSPLHLEERQPTLGDTLETWVRVPHGFELEAVHLRSVRDGEPAWAAATPVRRDPYETWWRAPLLVANPVTSYRFLLDRGSRGYAWLDGTGVHDHEVGDAMDFRVTVHPRAPRWVHDAIIYQIFPDRFARSSGGPACPPPAWAVPADWDDPVVERGPQTPLQLYGGDLRGIEERLDHLVSLGATALYLTPFFPAESNHRYNASTFDRVDPLLGGDAALTSLVASAHARGLRVLGDLTTNHTGSTHEWFVAACADPDAPEAAFYLFDEHPSDYECWFDERTLPKLDLRDPELRRRFLEGPESTVGRYLQAPFHLDGWRIDVANMTGRIGGVDVNGEVAATIRSTMDDVADDTYLLAEHFHDHTADLRRDGWHGTMNYLGFLRPVWMWLHDGSHPLPFLGMPVDVPTIGGDRAAATMRELAAQVPWARLTASCILLGSHDTPRIRNVVGSAARHRVAAGLLATYPGVPMLFMGDELGFRGVDGEDARTPMPWDRIDRTEPELQGWYRSLFALRRTCEALRTGGLRWVAARPELLAFLRETADQRLLVVAIRDGSERVELPAEFAGSSPQRLLGDVDVHRSDAGVIVSGHGPAFGVVEL